MYNNYIYIFILDIENNLKNKSGYIIEIILIKNVICKRIIWPSELISGLVTIQSIIYTSIAASFIFASIRKISTHTKMRSMSQSRRRVDSKRA
jgi:hypothetical protein